jgi:hypothetical protein
MDPSHLPQKALETETQMSAQLKRGFNQSKLAPTGKTV